MKRIDLMGPSGVGKSYLTNLMKNSSIRKAKIKHVLKNPKNVMATKSIHKYFENISTRKYRDNKEEYREFLKVCRNGLRHYPIGDLQFFHSIDKVQTVLKEIELMRQLTDDKIIMNHSLSQKVFFVIPPRYYEDYELVQDYFKQMPKPNGVIILSAPLEILVRRIKRRYSKEKTLGSEHQGLNNKELEEVLERSLMWNKIASLELENRGISVLEINTSLSDEVNLSEINKFINDI